MDHQAQIAVTEQRSDEPVAHRHPRPVQLMLTYFRINNGYEVKQISNSTWYKPGDWLSEATVKIICDRGDWEVVMEAASLANLPLPLSK